MRVFVPVCLLLAVLAGCVSPGPAHEVAFVATDFGFDGPAVLEAGWTEVALRNDGAEAHQAVFLRLEDGHTLEDLRAVEGEHFPDWVVGVGGPGVVEPGRTGSATILLEEGRYVVFCAIPSPDGTPHFVKGMAKEVEVVASNARSGALHHDAVVELADYAFAFDGVEGGKRTFKVHNGGDHAHEAILIRLHGEATVGDVLEALGPNGTGPPPADFVGGVGEMAPGHHAYFTADMSPGRYAWLCFLPGPQGALHVALGMVAEFTV